MSRLFATVALGKFLPRGRLHLTIAINLCPHSSCYSACVQCLPPHHVCILLIPLDICTAQMGGTLTPVPRVELHIEPCPHALSLASLVRRFAKAPCPQSLLCLPNQLPSRKCTDSRSNAGYCFVEFPAAESANKALAMNGTPIPGSNNRHFKLNWASGGGLIDRRFVAPSLSLHFFALT